MQFIKQILEEAVNNSVMAIKKNNTLPVLDFLKVYWKEDNVYILGTDLEVTIVSRFEHPDKFEPFLLDAAKSVAALKTLKHDEPIEVTAVDGLVTLKQGKSRFNLSCPPVDEYPDIENDEWETVGVFNKPALKALGKAVKFSGHDELRPIMMGALVESRDEGNINIVATDAHKLVKFTTGIQKREDFNSFVIPQKGVAIITKIYKDEVDVSQSKRKLLFNSANNTVIITKIDGKYPNYEVVIPKDNPNKITLDKSEFKDMLNQIGVVLNAASSIKIHVEGSIVTLDSEDLDFNQSAHSEMLAQVEMGMNEFNAGVNLRFLNQLVAELTNQYIVIEFSDPNKALVIKEDNTDYSLVSLLMPVMLN